MDEVPDTVRKETIVGGRYRLGPELGRGGHGIVYEATQLPLGRAVALKMLLPEALLVPGVIERFAREASLAQGLTHPHTVQILDFGQSDEGFPFIVFERLRGRTLEDEVALGPLPVERVVHIGSQVLRSLAEAHAQGIVHRDIKPSNIFLVEHTGEPDFVKVLDFGIARAVTAPGNPGLTRDGQLVGTPSYMAPEQVNGQEVFPATDIYAVGLVLAEALSGSCIMADVSPIRVWTRQASSDPVPLPEIVLASPLGRVIARATAKALAERYASCAEMLADLERARAATAPTDPFTPAYVPRAVISAPPTSGPAFQPTVSAYPATLVTASVAAGTGGPTSPLTLPANALPANASVPSPKKRSGPGCALIALAVTCVVASALAALAFSRGHALEYLRSASASAPSQYPAGKGTSLTLEGVSDRARELGYSIHDTKVFRFATYTSTTLSIARANAEGTISITDYTSAEEAQEREHQARTLLLNSAIVRDDRRLVLVAITSLGHPSRADADALLTALLR